MTSSRYDPQVYDLFHDPDGEDVAFHTDLAVAAGGPVLELGAGTGRTLLPAARRGVELHALELDPAMAARLREKAKGLPVHVHVGDMRAFDLGTRFPLVTIPFRTFLHNLTDGDRLATLRCARAHLRDGGELVFNVFHPSLAYMSAHAGSNAGTWRIRTERQRGDELIVMSEAQRFDTVLQHVHTWFRYEGFGLDGHLRWTYLHRFTLGYLYPQHVRSLLEATGFRDIHIGTAWDGGVPSADDDELLIRARRA